jgi:hypothetical protein
MREIYRKSDKEYHCAICKKYNRKDKLLSHIRNVHSFVEGIEFTCTYDLQKCIQKQDTASQPFQKNP